MPVYTKGTPDPTGSHTAPATVGPPPNLAAYLPQPAAPGRPEPHIFGRLVVLGSRLEHPLEGLTTPGLRPGPGRMGLAAPSPIPCYPAPAPRSASEGTRGARRAMSQDPPDQHSSSDTQTGCVLLGERHLGNVLAEYARHYNGHRPHQALRQAPPLCEPSYAVDVTARIKHRHIVGGLISEYRKAA